MDVSLLADAAVGEYVSAWKVVPVLIILLLWGRLLTWIDKDAPAILLPRQAINMGMIFPMIGAFLLFLILPGFGIAITVLGFVMLAELGAYLVIRNQKAGLGDLQTQFTDWLAGLRGAAKAVEAPRGDVLLMDKGGNGIPAPEGEGPERTAYEAVQYLLTEPLRKGAERIDLVPSDGQYASKYAVDGVAYAGANLDRTRGAHVIQYLKRIAAMDLNEKRKPQTGQMKFTVDGRKQDVEIETAGSSAGEQLRAIIDPRHRHHLRLEQLGMSDDQVAEVQDLISTTKEGGLVIVSAPRGQGLTSTLYGILRAHDAFLTHIMTIEPEPDLDLEGITQNKMGTVPNPVEDSKQITWCVSQDPEVLMVGRVEDGRSAQELAKFAAERRVYVALRAGSTFDALAVWRKLVGDDRLAMRNLRYVVSGRVVRKLCGACKVGYVPDPATLRKLNMDPERVGRLYQARTTPLHDPKGNPIACDFCRELMFRGRVGVYETLIVDDEVRGIIEAGGSVNQLKAAFRKQRGKYLQEQALARVQAGDTSVQEVLRVMKLGEAPTGSSGRAQPVTA